MFLRQSGGVQSFFPVQPGSKYPLLCSCAMLCQVFLLFFSRVAPQVATLGWLFGRLAVTHWALYFRPSSLYQLGLDKLGCSDACAYLVGSLTVLGTLQRSGLHLLKEQHDHHEIGLALWDVR